MATINYLDTSRIYNEKYSYSVPESELKKFSSGKAFDNKTEYTKLEQAELNKDIIAICGNIFNKDILTTISDLSQGLVGKKPVAVVTAGAPGAGKTMLMEQELAKLWTNVAYIDPDAVCLKEMKNTYGVDVKNDPSKEGRLTAYNKWRPASNFINHLVLGNLILDKLNFYFGTTSTGPFTFKFFEFLKKNAYQIELLHVSAEDDVRFASIQERDKTFIQTTFEDTKEKGLLLPQRINDTFLKYADTIKFYWRDGVKEDAKVGAIWTRNIEGSSTLGTLKIVDEELYENIKRVHDTVVTVLKRPDLDWKTSVEDSSTVIRH